MKTFNLLKYIKSKAFIFWDFDGVIKDSLGIKGDIFANIFMTYGDNFMNRVRNHHYENGGLSRYEKIRTYLEWTGEVHSVEELATQFSNVAIDAVINSPWVPGVESYLRAKPDSQKYILFSATPQEEIETILLSLELESVFDGVYGSPIDKRESIKKFIEDNNINPYDCIFIGDSMSDLKASITNEVKFILRKHELNADIFNGYDGLYLEDFLNI